MTEPTIFTETIAVLEAGIRRLKDGREVLNISTGDGADQRVFGSVKEEIVEACRPYLRAHHLTIGYHEEQRGKFLNRYLDAVRPATDEELRELTPAADTQLAAQAPPAAPTRSAASCTDQRRDALKAALRYLELRGPQYVQEQNQPGTPTVMQPTVAEVTALSEQFLAYIKGEAPYSEQAKPAPRPAVVPAAAHDDPDDNLPDDLVVEVGARGEEVWT